LAGIRRRVTRLERRLRLRRLARAGVARADHLLRIERRWRGEWSDNVAGIITAPLGLLGEPIRGFLNAFVVAAHAAEAFLQHADADVPIQARSGIADQILELTEEVRWQVTSQLDRLAFLGPDDAV